MFKATLIDIESIKQKLHDIFFNDLGDVRIFDSYIPPFGKHILQDEEKKPFNALSYIVAFLEDQSMQSLLVLGDSGMGKTLLSQYIAKQIWNNRLPLKAQRLPIYIYLPTVTNKQGELKEKLLETHLKGNCGLEKGEISFLKIQRIPLLLILDSIDEIRFPNNLYAQNQWQQWNLKLIFTCRPEALINYQNYQQYFYSNPSNLQANKLFSEMRLCPFDIKQIEQYVRGQLDALSEEDRTKIDPQWLSSELYIDAINTLPGLRELVETPFILSMVVQVLPEIMQVPEGYAKNHLTRVQLYQKFTQNWFNKQANRLQAQKNFPTLKGELASYLLHYAKNLALDRLVQGKLETAIDEQDTLGFYLLAPQDSELLISFELDQRVLEENIEAVRSGCLLKTQGKGFRFLHKSLLEYLAAEELLRGALGLVQTDTHRLIKSDKTGYAFQEQLLVDEPEIIARLAEFAQSNEAFKKALWQLIMLSKEDAYYSIAAANAITVWHHAEFSLINVDLRNTCLAGADLRHAMLISSRLDGADLQNVRLGGANLSFASLQGTCLAGIQLEQQPTLEYQDTFSLGIFALEPEGPLSKNRVAAADSCYVYIYKIDTGKLIVRLDNWSFFRTGWNSPKVRDVVWQPQGQQLAVSSSDGYIRLWNMQSYQCVFTLEAYKVSHWDDISTNKGHIGRGNISYHPNGKQLASVHSEYQYKHYREDICLWNTINGEKQKISEIHNNVWCIKFSPNGKQLIIGSNANLLILNALSIEKEKWHTGNHVHFICYSPDEKQIASSEGRAIILRDAASGEQQNVLQWDTDIISLAYRPDGKQLASGSEDGVIILWNVASGRKQRILQNSGPVKSLSYYQQGGQLLSSGEKGIYFWQVADSDEHMKRPIFLVDDLIYRPDGLQFASNQTDHTARKKDRTIRLWQTTSSKLERELGLTKPASYISYSPDGQQLASSQLSLPYKITLWDVESGKQQRILEYPTEENSIKCLSYRSDGLQLASGGRCAIVLWDIVGDKGPLILHGRYSHDVESIDYSPNGRQLASIDNYLNICLWDTQTTKMQTHWKSEQKEHSSKAFLRYRSDGQQLASSGRSRVIYLWDTKDYQCLQVLKHQASITCLQYSLDNQHLASGDSSNYVYLWNTVNGTCLGTFNLLSFRALALQFTQYETLRVGYENCVSAELKWYKSKQFKLQHISNKVSPALACSSTRLDNSFGLSKANLKVLQQQGASGRPSKEKYWSRGTSSTLFQAARPTKQAVRNIVGNHVILNKEFGSVSLLRSKKGNHAFFLIEVATNRGIKVHFADLTTPDGLLLQSVSQAKAKIKLELWRDDPTYSKLKEKVKDEFIYRTFPVPLDKLKDLYTSIEQDKSKEIYYSVSGEFYIGGRTYQNCMTWCLSKLKEIDIKLPEEWLPSPKLYLPEIKIEEEVLRSSTLSQNGS
jgi:WD40 repeat protein